MFTIEMEFDHTKIVCLDQKDAYDDVEVLVGEDDSVYMTQHCPDLECEQTIYMSLQQLRDLLAAFDLPEGAYFREGLK